ncbi:MAG: anti-sigma factor antagonist [Oscillospiraceae bacterium]|nr:anti-sigma factor antagonist [Oscillospiraceae bacterium]
MQLSTTCKDGQLELRLVGELDHHAAKQAMQQIGQAIDLYLPRDCVIDLGELTFMDSSGIAVVLNTHKRMAEIGGRAHVRNVPRQPMKVLAASGIDRIVSIAETV